MTLKAYLDNIKAKTGKTPEDFRILAEWNSMVTHRAQIIAPNQIDAEAIKWLKSAFEASG